MLPQGRFCAVLLALCAGGCHLLFGYDTTIEKDIGSSDAQDAFSPADARQPRDQTPSDAPGPRREASPDGPSTDAYPASDTTPPDGPPGTVMVSGTVELPQVLVAGCATAVSCTSSNESNCKGRLWIGAYSVGSPPFTGLIVGVDAGNWTLEDPGVQASFDLAVPSDVTVYLRAFLAEITPQLAPDPSPAPGDVETCTAVEVQTGASGKTGIQLSLGQRHAP